ncbi:MAG: aminotransferase class I/II-fold pyridoxal phosphate-dependent enzyme [Eudoraea sp.]|nr:aminotransferase class I/II-fold pyridoxal phosphate-dependent enzyme [Eudoraea sp.]
MKVQVSTYPGRSVSIDGTSFLYFGGTSYLGVHADVEFQDLVLRSVRQYGSNFGTSRRSNVQFSIYEEVESYMAKWVGSEACLTMSSGYLAGQLVANHFNTKEYKLFYSPNSHSALFRTNAKPYTTYTTLNIALREHFESKKNEIPVIFLDSIDFSGCNYPDFQILRTLPLTSCILVVDDSHGIGIVGKEGSGVFRSVLSIPCQELVLCASLGKALGLQAGAVFGKRGRIEQMKSSNFFGGASPAAPFYLAHFMEAKAVYSKKRRLLQDNIKSFLSGLKAPKRLNFMPDYPVFGFSDPQLTNHLRENNIIITDFRYPTEDTYATNRIVLTAAHTKQDIDWLVKALNFYE